MAFSEEDRFAGCMERREFAVTERSGKFCKKCDLKSYCDRCEQ